MYYILDIAAAQGMDTNLSSVQGALQLARKGTTNQQINSCFMQLRRSGNSIRITQLEDRLIRLQCVGVEEQHALGDVQNGADSALPDGYGHYHEAAIVKYHARMQVKQNAASTVVPSASTATCAVSIRAVCYARALLFVHFAR